MTIIKYYNEEISDLYILNENTEVVNEHKICLNDKITFLANIKYDYKDKYTISHWVINNKVYDISSNSFTWVVSSNIEVAVILRRKDNDKLSLTTSYFNFKLENPVLMLAELSFDGSVNLILTDNLNEPKLINTGFALRENNLCLIIHRYGKNNTNQYSLDNEINFNLQTSLYRNNDKLSYIEYNGVEFGGILPVGSYNFYIVTCDKDGNESDIIAESGVIQLFKGIDCDPFSVNGGIENESSEKCIKLKVRNLDKAYFYIKVYYSRCTSGYAEGAKTFAYKISLMYPILKTDIDYSCDLLITGYEETESIDISNLNIRYFNPDVAKTIELNQNILFMGNLIEKGLDEEEETFLTDLSLQIVPSYDSSELINLCEKYKYKAS